MEAQAQTPPLAPRPLTHRIGDPSAATDAQLLEVVFLQQRERGDASPEMREFLYRAIGRIL